MKRQMSNEQQAAIEDWRQWYKLKTRGVKAQAFMARVSNKFNIRGKFNFKLIF